MADTRTRVEPTKGFGFILTVGMDVKMNVKQRGNIHDSRKHQVMLCYVEDIGIRLHVHLTRGITFPYWSDTKVLNDHAASAIIIIAMYY